MPYEFSAELYEWEARENWFFVALPLGVSDEIRALPLVPGGFGSVKVEATVGHVTWQTSIFPDDGRGTFVLPIKKDVRVRNRLVPGGPVDVTLEIVR